MSHLVLKIRTDRRKGASCPERPPTFLSSARGRAGGFVGQTNLRSIAAAVVSAAALLGGCAPDHYPVTGKDDGDPGWHGTQSETASEVAFARGQKIFVTTYNDDTDDGKITNTANDRYGARARSGGIHPA